jgi:hypothetical protein
MCSCRVLALVALASSVTGQVALHDQVTLPAEDGKIEFMDQDSSFGYAVTTTNKLLKIDLTSAANYETSAGLAAYNSLYVLHEDDKYSQAERDSYTNNGQTPPTGFLYITGQTADGDNVLLKVNKDTMNVLLEYTYAASENIPYSIVRLVVLSVKSASCDPFLPPSLLQSDDNHVYTGQNTSPGSIIKIDKGTMTKIGDVTLDAGENDIRSMAFDSSDPSHLYANTNTVPGKVVKVDISAMQKVATATLTEGKNLLAGVEESGNFLYVGSNSDPAVISKIDKTTMTVDSEKVLGVGKAITAMASDAEHLYCGTYEQPGKILVIRKTDLFEQVALDLTQNDVTSVVTSGGGHMLIGTEAGMVAYTGLSVTQDCELGAWGVWGSCSTTCNTGFKTRQRVITQNAEHGGAACSEDNLTQDQLCNNTPDAQCPDTLKMGKHECHTSETGQTWRSLTHEQMSCTNVRDGNTGAAFTEAKEMCACPEDKPVFSFGRCVVASGCDTAEQVCSHTSCEFEAPAGSISNEHRVVVHHHGEEQHGTKIRCKHTLGRMGTCQCFCHDVQTA